MSERFTVSEHESYIIDNYTDIIKDFNSVNILEILNNLDNENKLLRSQLKNLRITEEEYKKKRYFYKKSKSRVINSQLKIYEKEYEDTPSYFNTQNCVLEGMIDELRDLSKASNVYANDGGLFCYLGGRIDALKSVKQKFIDDGYE